MPPRVLVVEDYPPLRTLLANVLSREGFDVRTASDGVEAVAALDDVCPDVVVSDFLMPGVDGLDLGRAVRRHPRCSGAPILVLTSADPDMPRVQELLQLRDVFVQRNPPDFRSLGERVRRLIHDPREE